MGKNKEEKVINYLTEGSLLLFLQELYPDHEIVHDRAVPGSKIKKRPDYRLEAIKLIVEFDGPQHYTSFNNIQTDILKDETYTKEGYKVVRVPYFVQLSNHVIKHLFGINQIITNPELLKFQDYKHGFIDAKAILPWDYCEKGIERFLQNLNKFNFIKKDILGSLQIHKNDMPTSIQKEMTDLGL